MNGDTGNRRRSIDNASTNKALELVCSLAIENALTRGDSEVIAAVESATLKLRDLKVGTTPIRQSYILTEGYDNRFNGDGL